MSKKQPTPPNPTDKQPVDNNIALQQELEKAKALLIQNEEITKKAQIDYINLKSDFDFLVRQTKLKEESLAQEMLIKTVKQFLPFIEDLRKSLTHLSDAQKSDTLGQGVLMVYDKFLKTLAEWSIFPIESLGHKPDLLFHEPVSMQPTEDKKHKGKIIAVFEQGFYYLKGEEKIVIVPSKVIIGS